MKLLLSALSVLAILSSSSAVAKTTLIDFGGSTNSFSSPWNLSSGTNPVLSSDLQTTSLKYTDSANSSVVVTYKAGGLAGTSIPVNAQLTGLTAQTAIGTSGLNMWQTAHGTALTDARIQNGWKENLLLGVGSLVTPGKITLGGLQKNSSYTVSSVFTVSSLANIASIKSAPVTMSGSNFTISHAYLAGNNGQIIDVLNIGSFELAGLLSGGTFMMTWQLTTNGSFTSASDMPNISFSGDLLKLAGDYGMSAMAVTEGTPDLSGSVPEPSSALLGAFGIVGLMLKRRRK